MPRYSQLQHLLSKPDKFRRITGVLPSTFELMVKVIRNSKKTGRPSKLSFEDQIMMTLEYLREYRTYAHVAYGFDIDEANCYRIIKKVENILIKDERFKLPKRTRVFDDLKIEAVLVDVTESPIQRPKKKSEKLV
jgi:Helix-turn-helix of DDE superfamily endonuclease